MRVSIHQPHYLPWLRYFDKIARSDVFVILDDAQFNINGWQNRNKLKGPGGSVTLTVPVLQHFQQPLMDVRINRTVAWQKKHWRTIEQHYRKAPYFEQYREPLVCHYQRDWDDLIGLNRAMLDTYLRLLGIETRILESRQMGIESAATTRLVDICKSVGATEYLSGAHAVGSYLHPETFAAAGVDLVIQEWECPRYEQSYPNAGFIPDLAILDLLFQQGPRSLQVLQSNSRVVAATGAVH